MTPVHRKIDCEHGQHVRVLGLDGDKAALRVSDEPVVVTKLQAARLMEGLAAAFGTTVEDLHAELLLLPPGEARSQRVANAI